VPKKHLKDGGRLIITTPNPFWIEYWIRKVFGKLEVFDEHTAWFDLDVLKQLTSRYGFIIYEYEFIQEKYKPKTLSGFFWHKIVMPILRRILPKDLLGECILVVLEAKDKVNKTSSNNQYKTTTNNIYPMDLGG